MPTPAGPPIPSPDRPKPSFIHRMRTRSAIALLNLSVVLTEWALSLAPWMEHVIIGREGERDD